MLQHSFVFLDGIGRVKERSLWQQGVTDWNTFLNTPHIRGVSPATKARFDEELRQAKKNFFLEQYAYFTERFPFSEQWRLYDAFKDSCVFLDIETSGYYGDITVVGLFDGYDTVTFVRGFNLDRRSIATHLARYKMILTFNGLSFDVPVLKQFFQFTVPHVHIDLRYVCAKLGYVGGLKAIEAQMNIRRPEAVRTVSGSDAVYLWNMWHSTRNRDYLQTLVQYNEEDVINLKPIAEKCIRELWMRTFHHPALVAQSRNP